MVGTSFKRVSISILFSLLLAIVLAAWVCPVSAFAKPERSLVAVDSLLVTQADVDSDEGDWNEGVSVVAVFDSSDGSMAFYNRPREDVPVPDGATVYDVTLDGSSVPWLDVADQVLSISFVDEVAPTSTELWFDGMSSCVSMDLVKLDVSNTTDMLGMFHGCSSLASLELSEWDTSNVLVTDALFAGCSSLTSLNLSGWDISNVVSMQKMFYGCSSLNALELSEWDTSNVIDMYGLFHGCSSLASLDLSEWDISSVERMDWMFYDCWSLTSLDLSGWQTSSVYRTRYMFAGCPSLVSLDLSGFDTSHVTEMEFMFTSCSSLISLDLSSFDTSSAQNMYGMFKGCSSLAFLDLSNFVTGSRTNMGEMFSGCSQLSELVLGEGFQFGRNAAFDRAEESWSWAKGSPTSSERYTSAELMAHYSGSTMADTYYWSEGPIALAVFDPSDGSLKFYNRMRIEVPVPANAAVYSVPLDGLSVPWSEVASEVQSVSFVDRVAPTSTTAWFKSMGNCLSMDLASLDTSDVQMMFQMFWGCSSLQTLDLSSLSTSKAKDMGSMFLGCSSLRFLDLSSFNTSKVINMGDMFYGCSSLSQIELGKEFSFKTDCVFEREEIGGAWAKGGPDSEERYTSAELVESYDGATMADTYYWSIRIVDISGEQVVLDRTSFEYSGLEQKPAVITVGGKSLVEGRDYSLSYADNVNAGTATATVIGMGNCAGTTSAEFEITKASIDSAEVAGIVDKEYTGEPVSQADFTVTVGGRALEKDTDYIVGYSDNVNAGTVTMTIAGEGNYSGSKALEFQIAAARIDTEDTEVAGILDKVYTGEPVSQTDFAVTVGGRALEKDADYIVGYSDNVNAGTATMTIEGTGNYVGSKDVEFDIAPASIEGAVVSLEQDRLVFDGFAKEPGVRVKVGEKPLVAGVDFDVSYQDNVKAGVAKAVVAGTGNYSGTIDIEFEIARADISGSSVDVDDQVYAGDPLEPGVSVRLGDAELERDADYTVAYSGNDGVGDAVVTVLGIGNYTGQAVGGFKIYTGKIDSSAVSDVGKVVYSGVPVQPEPVVKVGGVALVVGADFKVAYANNLKAGKATMTVTGIGDYFGEAELEFEIAKRVVTLSSASRTKAYDGVALTAPQVTVGGDGFVDGEVTDMRATGSIVGTAEKGGTAKNTIAYTTRAGFDAGNYVITKNEGILTVKALPQHTLSIKYVYADGKKAKDPYVKSYVEGAKYDVAVPAIAGYEAAVNGVKASSVKGTMGKKDVSVTVTYTATVPAGKGAARPHRLAGDAALDTMATIVNEGGFPVGGTVVLTTVDGYWDALTAAGIAGKTDAPVLMTNGNSLSWQTRALIQKLKPSQIIICGGIAAVTEKVEAQAKAAAGGNPDVIRCAGDTATGTACKIFEEGGEISAWSNIAFVCTNAGYWDALAAAPISYANDMPIFLTEGKNGISSETLNTMKKGGIEFVYIVGGTAAISDNVRAQLDGNHIRVIGRFAGIDAIHTSQLVAEFGVDHMRMTSNNMGVATSGGYWDALAGAALCGREGSVLVLADGPSATSVTGFMKGQADKIADFYIFGGTAVVTKATENAAIAAAK